MFEFPTSFRKMRGNDPRRCLTFRLTSVLIFESLWLLQGKLQWPERLRLHQHRHRARFSTWRSSIPKWRILFFTSANQWSCLNCILFHTVPRPIVLPNFQSQFWAKSSQSHSTVVRLVFLSSFLGRLKRDPGVVQYPWSIGLSCLARSLCWRCSV